jgi:hypothetical protein
MMQLLSTITSKQPHLLMQPLSITATDQQQQLTYQLLSAGTASMQLLPTIVAELNNCCQQLQLTTLLLSIASETIES